MTAGEKRKSDAPIFLDKLEFRDAALLSYVTSAIIVPAYDKVKLDFEIIRAEYLLLMCLSHYPVLTAQDVSLLTGRPRNSISRAVKRMLQKGFIKRVPDPNDGRQSRLTVTKSGREMHEKVAAQLTSAQERVLDALTPAERKTLVKLLKKTAKQVATRS